MRGVRYEHAVRSLTGFAGVVRIGYFGRGRNVQGGTVSGALTAIGNNLTLVKSKEATKLRGKDKYLSRISQMLDGFKKDNPPTVKKLPCTIDLPEKMVSWGLEKGATPLEKAVGDIVLVVMYYLLRIGGYTVKRYNNDTKQTKQYKMRDVTFFKYCKRGRLRRLGRNTKDKHIMTTD